METEPLIPGADARRSTDAALSLLMPEAKLWLAVLKQAVHELRHPWSAFRRRKAREWFESESEETGAFLWITTMLHLEPGPLRRRLLTIPLVDS